MLLFLSLLIPVGIVYAILMGILYLFSFDLLTFNLFLAIPVGAIISGYLMFMKFGSTLEKKDINTKKFGLLIFALSIVLFVGIQFGQYRLSYIDESGQNFKMHGDHISAYINPNTGEEFTFISYIIYITNISSISFSRRANSIFKLDGWSFLNWIFYLISYIGFYIGVGASVKGNTQKMQYCDPCKKYMKNKLISVSDRFSEENMILLKQTIENSDSIVEHLKEHPATKVPTSSKHYKLTLHHCESCKNGYVEIIRFKKYKGKYVDESNKDVIKVNHLFVTEHLVYSPN